MDFLLWVCIAAAVAAVATGCLLVIPMLRGRTASARKTSRTSQVRDQPSTTGGGTAFGRLSTIR